MNEKALVIWLAGLAGSGKSTIARKVYATLKKKMPNVVYLDGDELRDILGHDGYDKQGRIDVAKKRVDIANFLSMQGIVVVVTTISMFDEVYEYMDSKLDSLCVVHVQCTQEELLRRDQKGLYQGALRGEIKDVVGMDIPYDPIKADLVLDNTAEADLEKNVQKILDYISL